MTSNFKLKDMKIFGSSDSMYNNEKNYRQVFDESESTYIWTEFSFYNKLFDENDWHINCHIKAFDVYNHMICDQDASQDIKKEDNIIYIRKGWGTDNPGDFWRKGNFRWEAWVDEQLIATAYFYIVNKGKVTDDNNPYFAIRSIRLFEGETSSGSIEQRLYLKAFKAKTTRFIWYEFKAENLFDEEWPCELFFYFINDANQIKAKIPSFSIISPSDNDIYVCNGWGAVTAGTWFDDNFRLDIVFMDQIIASLPFTVGEEEIEADESYSFSTMPFINPQNLNNKSNSKTLNADENLEQIMAELDKMIGMENIKTRIRNYIDYLKFIKVRSEKGIEESEKINLHSVFTGNPGTGKTTIARLLGRIYKKIGLLSRGHVVEVDRADLVAEFIGQTAPKTKKMIQKAYGGILFIDEAYSLARQGDDSKDFGREAIEILLKEMSDNQDKFCVIVAGYPDEMNTFLNSNPGLKSRFNLYYDFPDYTPQELMQITEFYADKRSLIYTQEAKDFLYEQLVEAYRKRDKTFGNSRYAIYLIDESKLYLGLRLMKNAKPEELTKEQLSTIELADIQSIFSNGKEKIADIPVNETDLKEALNELNSLIGLENVKHEIEELVKLVRYYKEIGKEFRNAFSLHAVFSGNPGTGKTTVARILANIYKALGILERGHLVECDRQHFIAGYIGQTGEKTDKLIDSAKGGVLFIDEAYALAEGGVNDYGQEAIAILLKRMEDERGQFAVIVAGYTERMKIFLEANPGLSSRFDQIFHYKDYSENELYEILTYMLSRENMVLAPDNEEQVKKYLKLLCDSKDEYFGNARIVRRLVEESIKHHDLRLASLDTKARTKEMLKTLDFEDVEKFIKEQTQILKKNRIGFQIDKN